MSDDQDGCEWVNVFFWYRLTRVVPDKRPLNGCVCGLTYLLHKSKMGRKFPRRDEYLTIGSVRCLGRQSSVVTISLFFILF